LKILFDTSIKLGKLPEDWKIGHITAVYKKGNKNDIKEIEKIQKRATKLIISLKNKPYKERLMHLKLPTLKFKHMRGDMIEVFKLTYNMYDDSVSPQLSFCTRSITRGNKTSKSYFSLRFTENFFYSTYC